MVTLTYYRFLGLLIRVEGYATAPLLGKVRSPPTSVLDIKRNHLMVTHHFWIFGECGVPLHCHYSQVHSDLES